MADDDLQSTLQRLDAAVASLGTRLAAVETSLALVQDVTRFTPLQQLLAAGELEAADRETSRLLPELLGRSAGEVEPEDLERFPLPPLRIIDQLWSQASGGRFGFAAQARLYRDLGGSVESLIALDEDLFARFRERVGWPAGRAFSLLEDPSPPAADAPDGHLPLRCWYTAYGLKAANLLMARLIEGGL
ncbi:GUN4 domain-containing protein [Vulcanococcus limneticus]|uniref:GUN4 domain-containing protein n=1 Tax=Vulcanococcus limneticus TaxID=2170428 RepID=UPI00398BDB85